MISLMSRRVFGGSTLAGKGVSTVRRLRPTGFVRDAAGRNHRERFVMRIPAPAHFVVAEGIIGIEGNGPLQSTARSLGRTALAADPFADFGMLPPDPS
jgi:hypothetical protein